MAKQVLQKYFSRDALFLILSSIITISVFLTWIDIPLPDINGVPLENIPGAKLNGWRAFGILTFWSAVLYTVLGSYTLLTKQVLNTETSASVITKVLGGAMGLGILLFLILTVNFKFSFLGVGWWVAMVCEAVFLYLTFFVKKN